MDEKMNDILLEQLDLLSKWNKENIAIEPEQTRKNIETIFDIATYFISRNSKIDF